MNESLIFTSALKLTTPADRAAFLDAACTDDPALRAGVEALLQAHASEPGFLEDPGQEVLPSRDRPSSETLAERLPLEKPGTQIGPYKLLEQIGEGGMGVVYLAEQLAPIERRVAIKIIKPGMDTRQVIARFEAERQALAVMNHVNIARVLDAGTTVQGRPYFVMELVHGVPITQYCDDNCLTPRQRLELFVPVCLAIQHAHQKGIIHRDIKPSNVLVTLYDGQPVPKVIDFGVAKATEQKLTEQTLFTQYGTLVGTLEYMSPEQAEMSALGVDTRSDIYSLGVLLYELLTGNTPLSHKTMKEAAYGEILRLIKEEEPPKPSTRLSDSGEALASISANRHTEPAKLSKLMRGELDWIVMKCLEKDRGRRYATANGFAMDVHRYLNDETVQACPPSAAYRFRKFARRNKRALATVALLGAMLLLGVVLLVVSNAQIKKEQFRTEIQKTRAETALGDSRENLQLAEINLGLALEALDEVFVKEIEKRALHKRELTPADRDFLRKGLQFYEQFGKRNGTNAALQGATAMANRRAGYLRLELAQWQEAEAHFRKAIPLLEKLASDSPTAEEFRRELASAYHGLSIGLSNMGELPEAKATCRQAIVLWRQLSSDFPAVREYQAHLGQSLWQLRTALSSAGTHQEAESSVREALNLYEDLAVAFPKERLYRQETAFSHRHLSEVLQVLGRAPEAVENLQRAVVLYAGLVAESPHDQFYRQELALSYGSLADALRNCRRAQEAETAERESLALHEKLAKEAPKVAVYRKRLAESQRTLAGLLRKKKFYAEAEQCYQRARDLYQALAAEDQAVPGYWKGLARAYHELAQLLQAAGRPREVQQAYAQAVHAHRKELTRYEKRAADSPTQDNRWHVADCLGWLGEGLRQTGQPEEAIQVWRASAAVSEKLVNDFNHPRDGWMLGNRYEHLGELFKHLGRHQEAESAYRDAVAAWTKVVADFNQPDHRAGLVRAQGRLAEVLVSQGKHDEAIVAFKEAIRLKPGNTSAHQSLGRILRDSKQDYEGAIRCFSKAIELDPKKAQFHQDLADALRSHGKLDEAIAAYGKAIELDPHDNDARRSLRLASSEQQSARFPNNAQAHFNLGNALREQQKLDEAIKAFRKTLEVDPQFTVAHIKLGNALREQQKLDEAIACYHKAIELDPKAAWAHYNLGYALRFQGKLEEAIVAFKQAIELDPRIAQFHQDLGDALSLHGKLDEAIAAFGKAIELNPTNASGHNSLGDALTQQGRLDEAIAAFEEALRLQPGNATAHFRLASALAQSKQWDRSATVYGEALQRFGAPLWPGPWHDAIRSEEMFTRLTALRPDDHLPWITRARLGILQRDWNRAAVDYARANELLASSDQATLGRESDDLFSYAGLLLLLDDRPAYEQLCQKWTDQFGPDESWEFSLSRACVVSPHAIVPSQQLVERGRKLVQARRKPWYLHVLSLAHYRNGEFDLAIERAMESNTGEWSGSAKALNWLALAMAHHRLGRAAEARTSLEQALLLAGRPSPEQPPGVQWPDMAPTDAVEYELLRREAENLIDPKGETGQAQTLKQ